MKKKMFINNQNGGAAVEFAIILPVLIFLIFVIIEGGLFLYNQHIITNATREGARAGIVATISPARVNNNTIYAVVEKYAKNHLITFGNKIFSPPIITPSDEAIRNSSSFGDDLTVEILFDYDFLVLSAFGFGPIEMHAQTVMKME